MFLVVLVFDSIECIVIFVIMVLVAIVVYMAFVFVVVLVFHIALNISSSLLLS